MSALTPQGANARGTLPHACEILGSGYAYPRDQIDIPGLAVLKRQSCEYAEDAQGALGAKQREGKIELIPVPVR